MTACGGNLKDPTNYPNATYHGEMVYFCTRARLHAFDQDPDVFIAGRAKHPIEEE
jgi:YHS domain-containing protein